MKRNLLDLGGGCTVEQVRRGSHISYLAYVRGMSCFCNTPKELRQVLKLPLKTPSRDALDAWLQELEGGQPAPALAASSALTWGPEAHSDEGDPVAGTQMVI